MNTQSSYTKHYKDPEFDKLFIGFKEYVLQADIDAARECAEHISDLASRPEIDLLEIGCGEGTISLVFLAELAKERSISGYVGIDVAPLLISEISSKKTELEKYVKKVEVLHQDATTYNPQEKKDIILSLNSWYGMPFPMINSSLSHLKPGGVLIILLNSQDGLTLDLTRKFVEPIISSEDLENWLNQQNISYSKKRVVSNMSKSDFILDNKINLKAEYVFRYLLRRKNEPITDIIGYLSKKPEEYFKIPQDIIIISKT